MLATPKLKGGTAFPENPSRLFSSLTSHSLRKFHRELERYASNKMNIRRAIIICFFMSLRFSAYVLAAAEEPDLVQAAKREGRVVWYTVAGESQQLAQEFERKYPFVKVEVVRSTVYPLLTRILNEARTGNYL